MLTLFTQSALALSCIFGVHDSNVDDGATVPANTVIQLAHTYEAGTTLDVVLTGPGGVVPSTLQVDDGHAVLTPDALLEPGTYTLSGGDDFIANRTFTVEGAEDASDPAVPAVLSARRHHEKSEWGDVKGIDVELEIANEIGLWHQIEIATDASFTDATSVYGYDAPFIGIGLCTNTFADYDRSTPYFLRARAVDLAGNTSDWSDTVEVARGLGCSSTGATGSLFLAFAGLLGLRRRLSRA